MSIFPPQRRRKVTWRSGVQSQLQPRHSVRQHASNPSNTEAKEQKNAPLLRTRRPYPTPRSGTGSANSAQRPVPRRTWNNPTLVSLDPTRATTRTRPSSPMEGAEEGKLPSQRHLPLSYSHTPQASYPLTPPRAPPPMAPPSTIESGKRVPPSPAVIARVFSVGPAEGPTRESVTGELLRLG